MRQLNTIPTLDWLRSQRDTVLRLAAQHKVNNVRVFGSVARGEATPESDVDLLVSVGDGVSVFELVGLWLDLQEALGRDVSLISDETPDERFMKSIQADSVVL